MNLFKWLQQQCVGRIHDDSAALLDFVPIGGSGEWRESKLKAAASRMSKPFKCAPVGLPRERMKGPPAPEQMPVWEVVR